MKTTLIMLPQPILVSCEKPTEWYLDDTYTIRKSFTDDEYYWSKRPEYKKIIAGIEGLPKLDLSLIAERIGCVDIEKLAYDIYPINVIHTDEWKPIDSNREKRLAFIVGYTKSQSLNEKKWTDDDMIDFYNFISSYPNRELKRGLTLPYYLEKFKQSRKPKEYQVEWIQEGDAIKITKIIN